MTLWLCNDDGDDWCNDYVFVRVFGWIMMLFYKLKVILYIRKLKGYLYNLIYFELIKIKGLKL